VDPTGAGDCFGGAYLTCRRLGMSEKYALTYASAAGARNVTVLGPMECAGTRQELDAFIASTERRSIRRSRLWGGLRSSAWPVR
ncbi:PfkB family carbohydrate kinase, partial [Rhizobium leguminosarum]|uniref:PfkB family carbohydrate kinase n=1 Tax=Rhizobium leguminosarum TaxID=384 RepID=UPI003F950970